MSGRSARRARQEGAQAEPTFAPTLPYPDATKTPDGKCWICGEDDHRFTLESIADAATRRAGKRKSAINTPAVANAMWHVILAAYGPVIGRGIDPASAPFLEAFSDVATAMGHYGGALEAIARQEAIAETQEQAVKAATLHAIDVFFEQLLERGGDGVYQFELRRNRDGVMQRRWIQ